MLVVAFGLAFAFAILWVMVMTLTLPRSDAAYGAMPFSDPLVFAAMSIVASIAAIITFPFLYFTLRDRMFPHAFIILAGVVVIEIVVVTPLHAPYGFLGSFMAYVMGLYLARRFAPAFVAPGHCPKCGYDLRGTPVGNRCSECGHATTDADRHGASN